MLNYAIICQVDYYMLVQISRAYIIKYRRIDIVVEPVGSTAYLLSSNSNMRRKDVKQEHGNLRNAEHMIGVTNYLP